MLSAGLLYTALRGDQRWVLGALGALAVLGLGMGFGTGEFGQTGRPAAPRRHRPGRCRPGTEMGSGNAGSNPQPLCAGLTCRHGHPRCDYLATAIPVLLDEVRPFITALTGVAQQANVDYVTGCPTGSWETLVFITASSAWASAPGLYHKRRLLRLAALAGAGIFPVLRDWVDLPMARFYAGWSGAAAVWRRRPAGGPVDLL